MIKICFYISSHGFGHFARDIVLINEFLKRGFYVYAKSLIDRKFFNQRIINKYSKNFKLIPAGFDAGCVQKNFTDLDIPKTIQNIKKIIKFNYRNLESEKNFLTKNNINAVISDAASFPLFCAKEINIHSILMTNFTWYDIYSRFPELTEISDELKIIKKEYQCADVQFFPGIEVPNNYIKNKIRTGFISADGKNIRNELTEKYKIKNKKFCFIYFGSSPNDRVCWKNLEKSDDYVFITHVKI